MNQLNLVVVHLLMLLTKLQAKSIAVSQHLMKKGSFTKPNSPTEKGGRRNILGSFVMIVVKGCFVAPAKSGVSLQWALEVHG